MTKAKKSISRKAKLKKGLPRSLKSWLPKRKAQDNKSHGGRVLLLAGSQQMPGAALLAAKAAARTGAGYIYTTCKDVIRFFPETILWNKKNLSKISAVLIGPGLGINTKTSKLITAFKKNSIPVVIDADALTVAAQKKLYPFPNNWIATPHPGELARFFNVTADTVQKDRIGYARKAQSLLGCTVVLKGFETLIASDSDIFVNKTGNVALAKGGSGDVLGGMITALMAQGVPPLYAALMGCYLHGLIADQWVRGHKDYLSMTPSDIIDQIPKTLFDFRR